MILNKWNYDKHKYDSYAIPDNWNVKCDGDLAEVINCAQCGREKILDECYTSMEIHTPLYGFGFLVCEDCHNEEMQRKMRYRNE